VDAQPRRFGYLLYRQCVGLCVHFRVHNSSLQLRARSKSRPQFYQILGSKRRFFMRHLRYFAVQ
jgi:hypothetical protein